MTAQVHVSPGLTDRRPVTSRVSPLAAGLTPAQHEAVFCDDVPLCILAGAGAGKTRVLTRRIARRVLAGDAAAEATLAVTFTRKAAGELSARLRVLGVADGVSCGTFHALAYRMLRQRWSMRGERPLRVTPRKGVLVERALRRLRVDTARVDRRALVAAIERTKGSPGRPAATGGIPGLGATRYDDVLAAYETEKRRAGLLDFEDLLIELTIALETDPAFAHTIRRSTRHVFVDEFQDVTPVQHSLVAAWVAAGAGTAGSGTPASGGRADLCVVGDHAQSIYRFGGSDPAYLLDFRQRWPGARVLVLDDNFRCPPSVLALADAVLDPGRTKPRQQARVADRDVPELVAHPDEAAELRWIVATLQRRRRPAALSATGWGSMAVLVRTNRQAATVWEALTAAGVPCQGDSHSARSTMHAVLDKVVSIPRPPRQPLAAFVSESIGELGDTAVEAATGDLLVELAEEFERESDAPADAVAFADYASAAMVHDSDPGIRAGGVAVLTMHRAKGVEFDVVILPALEEGLLPVAAATSGASLDDERRLLYVAMTRARRHLHLSWAQRRAGRNREPSRFVAPIAPVLQDLQAAGLPAPPPQAIRDRPPPAVDGPSAPLAWALRTWRRSTAQADRCSPMAVLPDCAVAAVAATRPSTPAELARIPGVDAVRLERHGAAILRLVETIRSSGPSSRAADPGIGTLPDGTR